MFLLPPLNISSFKLLLLLFFENSIALVTQILAPELTGW